MDPPFPPDIPASRPARCVNTVVSFDCAPVRVPRLYTTVTSPHEGETRRRTQQLGDHALDRSTTEHGERVATVRGDDLVVRLDGVVHSDRHGLLFTQRERHEARRAASGGARISDGSRPWPGEAP